MRVEQEILNGTCKAHEVQDCFVEGLCRMLAGMNAATLRYKVSTVMSHLMVCNGGTWFKFLLGFINLLMSQLEATIDNKYVMVRVRTNLLNGKTVAWTDSSADDYLYRPKHPNIDGVCSYKMIIEYKKLYKSFKQMTSNRRVLLY